MSVISAKYIETGLVFTIITALFVAIPYMITLLAFDSKEKHNFPGIIEVLAFPVITSNYLFVLAFFALFVTRYEWLLRFDLFNHKTGLQQCFSLYLITLFILQVLFIFVKYAAFSMKWPFVSRWDPGISGFLSSQLRKGVGITVILISLLFTGVFDYVLYSRLGWFPEFMSRAFFYIFCIILIVGIAFLMNYLSKIYGQNGRRLLFWLVGAPLFLTLYYFALSSYEFGIYINIPISRGGKYPITVSTLDMKKSEQGLNTITGYVIEETDNYYYLVGCDVPNWFNGHPPVTGIRKDNVDSVKYTHLKSGHPRINHLEQTEPSY